MFESIWYKFWIPGTFKHENAILVLHWKDSNFEYMHKSTYILFKKWVFLKISKIRKMSCSVSLNEVMILQPTCISIAITVQWTILEILEFFRTPTPTELIVPLFCLFLHKKGIKAWYLASNFTTDIETLVEQWMYPSAAIHTLLFVKKKNSNKIVAMPLVSLLNEDPLHLAFRPR